MWSTGWQQFEQVKGYEGLYTVSEIGMVFSLRRGKFLRGGCFPNGYKFVCLRKDGKNKNLLIHRLVAEAFIPNPKNLPCVNHKDGNKQNNNVENLEWCTQGENLKHAVEIGLIESQCKIRRKVKMIDLKHEQTFDFSTMVECCEFFGFRKCWLGNYIKRHGNPCRYGEFEIHVSERA